MTTQWCWQWCVDAVPQHVGETECVAVLTPSQIFSIGTTVLVILASQIYGWDRHVWDLRPAMVEQGRQVSHPRMYPQRRASSTRMSDRVSVKYQGSLQLLKKIIAHRRVTSYNVGYVRC